MKLEIEVPDNVVKALSKDGKYSDDKVKQGILISICAQLYKTNQHIPEIVQWIENWYLDMMGVVAEAIDWKEL